MGTPLVTAFAIHDCAQKRSRDRRLRIVAIRRLHRTIDTYIMLDDTREIVYVSIRDNDRQL
jgi:hypothetical protein